MRINFDALTEGEMFIVEWQYRYQMGGFRTALIEAISHADIVNQAKLAKGFPEEVEAYRNFSRVSGWWEEVQKKAGIIKEEGNAEA